MNCGARLTEGLEETLDKRLDAFAEEIGELADQFGKKAEQVAKRIYEDIRDTSHRVGKKVEDTAKNIEKKLSPETKYCTNCGAGYYGAPRFCRDCGNKL
jgi:hypothetical protein